ncbi:MAG: hypothetical protein ACK4UJ_09065 [Leptonema sp. (in: bacteria)]
MKWEYLEGVSMREDRLDAGNSETFLIVITEVTEVRIYYRYYIINEIVETLSGNSEKINNIAITKPNQLF